MAKVRGGKELRAALKKAPPALREEAMVEVEASTRATHARAMAGFATAGSIAPFWHGKPGMQRITGLSRRLYRWSVSKAKMHGRVGLLTPASERRAFYLRVFLFGSKDQPARNVHDDAFEEERDPYIENQERALERVLRKL